MLCVGLDTSQDFSVYIFTQQFLGPGFLGIYVKALRFENNYPFYFWVKQ